MKKKIYLAQFGTGSSVNLLPLAAGQLVSRLKKEKDFLEDYELEEIIFRRENPEIIVSKMSNVLVAGFSCFLWNTNHSLAVAKKVKEKFPDSLIVFGGPSIPKDKRLVENFLKNNNFIDVIALDEGEEVFTEICKKFANKESFEKIAGIIYKEDGSLKINPLDKCVDMNNLPSPYVDGTFEEFYKKYSSDFSGIILETNRGCPYSCTYCTWGNQLFKNLREKPIEIVKKEIEWVGRNNIKYIALSDANFGIRKRDIDFVNLLAETKQKYGFPKFISVSWVKDSSDKVLKIAEILKKNEIGFRITLSLQSLNPEVVKAINRVNIRQKDFNNIKDAYRKDNLYSYTELIFGLPLESYESYISGIENSLSPSVFDQLYVYPLFLFPNTEMGSPESREKYGIESNKVECIYTKSKVENEIKEEVEIVIGHKFMPKDKWVEAFVVGYHTLGMHDDRLMFFVFNYLKKEYNIKITDLTSFAKEYSEKENLKNVAKSFSLLKERALGVQKECKDHLIRPRTYGEIPFDPPEGVFLEILLNKDEFHKEFFEIVKKYLEKNEMNYDEKKLEDLFKFQNAIIAHPNGSNSKVLKLDYDWIKYFKYSFHLKEEPLEHKPQNLIVIDIKPSNGDSKKFLKNHFDIRGVPAFCLLYNQEGKLVFPPVKMQHLEAPERINNKINTRI
ncbi:B12-binding domain-containing radical SAM protein [Candidatus Pacearchaeota archaeon]|nr:B12-binding domain-containing radical SAM protein [Candidatus Pacearchaeota archaeon]